MRISSLSFVISVALVLSMLGSVVQAVPVPFYQDILDGQSKKIVTMGTSLTANAAWVSQMTTWLKNEAPNPANVTVVNVGVAAASSDNVNPALSGIDTQLPNAKAQNPDVVFIEYGINDAFLSYGISQAQSKANLNFIIDDLETQNPNVEVVLMTMTNPVGNPLVIRPQIASYYQGYRDVAQDRGLLLIDHYLNWLDLFNNDPATWNSYVIDGVHSNALGATNVILPQIVLDLNGAPVPEPSTLAMIALGFMSMLTRRRGS